MFSKFQFLDAVKNPLQKIKASIKQVITKQKIEITPIIPNKLSHISSPTSQNIDSLLQQLKNVGQFQIWNFGEYSYNEEILTKLLDSRERNSDGKQIVYNLTYEYFANIPFCEMIKAIENIEAFLSLSHNNRVYIHCQNNKRRSAVFLASYIFLTGLETDIVTSILKVNQMLKISIEDKEITQSSTTSGAIYKSQHLVLKNLMNYINNSTFINKNGWNLKKILINNAPKIHLVLKLQNFSKQKQQTIKFKVLLEIRSAQGIMYKKIFQDEFIEGQSLCLRIPENEPVVLKDDFLIIVKYVYEKKGYSILRAQLNTNFIYDPYFRVQRNDMDLSVNNAHPQNETVFMDLLLQSNPKELSELSQLNILKENIQSQKIVETEKKEGRKQSLEIEKKDNENKKVEHEEQEDGFGILDQEQQAEHNQKMQREIEEQLARELENMRKKRNPDAKKSQETHQNLEESTENKQVARRTNTETEKSESQSEKDKENVEIENRTSNQKSEIKTSLEQKDENSTQIKENALNQQTKQDQEPKNQDQEDKDSENEEASEEQSSSSQQQSSSEQAPEQEQDLDDYLTKLQSQAEKHG